MPNSDRMDKAHWLNTEDANRVNKCRLSQFLPLSCSFNLHLKFSPQSRGDFIAEYAMTTPCSRSAQTLPNTSSTKSSSKIVAASFGCQGVSDATYLEISDQSNNGVTRARNSSSSPIFDLPKRDPKRKWRIALYSHDTMGLGHKRRNLLIAQTLGLSPLQADILIISGMRDASQTPMPPGVDCLTLPALTKNIDGQYQPRQLDVSLREMIALRSQVIRATLKSFAPDIFIVDNVPRGAVQELDPVLEYLRTQGHTRCILGLRDVLDEPTAVRRDWERAGNEEAIRDYYDAVWVYGDRTIYDMQQEYQFAPETIAKFHYMGYLNQRLRLKFVDDSSTRIVQALNLHSKRLVLGLVGGGQDGAKLANAFVQAELPSEAHGILLTGPFMPGRIRQRLRAYAAHRSNITVLDYLPEPSVLLNRADRIIAMGGYNTTCEILSFQKQALIVPRIQPRQEQFVRAERLQQLGVVDVLHPNQVKAEALTTWLQQPDCRVPCMVDRIDLNGLSRIPLFLGKMLTVPPPNQCVS